MIVVRSTPTELEFRNERIHWIVLLTRLSALAAPAVGIWTLFSHHIMVDILFGLLLLPSISLLAHQKLDTFILDKYLNKVILKKQGLLGLHSTEYRLDELDDIEIERHHAVHITYLIAFIFKPGIKELLTPYPVGRDTARDFIRRVRGFLGG